MGQAHITLAEEEKFGKYPYPVRQSMYAKQVCKKNPEVSFTDLTEAIVWKFGECNLKTTTLETIMATARG